jgi:hypothetical protein
MEVVSAIDFLNGRASLLGDAGKIEVIRKKRCSEWNASYCNRMNRIEPKSQMRFWLFTVN